ncbi:GlsB/YeaQ/YmgE family stress response membrane protein [Pelomicrobium sp.]|uniref:GlsB/YeaQ/YmgE family stress response membrane protein n=1 Tax=Pelomicrobium sp. TaxID=2815319 RepID=UPI002FDE50FF
MVPGKDVGGIVVTIAIGIAGALIGGFIGTQLGFGTVTGFDFRSLVIAVLGAVLLLVLVRLLK